MKVLYRVGLFLSLLVCLASVADAQQTRPKISQLELAPDSLYTILTGENGLQEYQLAEDLAPGNLFRAGDSLCISVINNITGAPVDTVCAFFDTTAIVNIYTDNGTIPEPRTVNFNSGGITWTSPDSSQFYIESQGTNDNYLFNLEPDNEQIVYQIVGDQLTAVFIRPTEITSLVGPFGTPITSRKGTKLTDDGFLVGSGVGVLTPTAGMDVIDNTRLRTVDENVNVNRILGVNGSGYVFWRDADGIGQNDTTNIYVTDDTLNSPRLVTMLGRQILWSGGSFGATDPDYVGGGPPISSPGRGMMWIADQSSFRYGEVDGPEWSTDSLGYVNFAGGYNSVATGDFAFAHGFANSAHSSSSLALGQNNRTIGNSPGGVALGDNNFSDGYTAFAMGAGNRTVGNDGAFAIGSDNFIDNASDGAITIGRHNTHTGNSGSVSIGSGNTLTGSGGSFVIGLNNNNPATNGSGVIGANNSITGSVGAIWILGQSNNISGSQLSITGRGNTITDDLINLLGQNNSVDASGVDLVGRTNTILAGGTNSSIFGTGNTLSASGNFALGENNSLTGIGTNSFITGKDNTITGPNATVFGINNRIEGFGNSMVGTGNIDLTGSSGSHVFGLNNTYGGSSSFIYGSTNTSNDGLSNFLYGFDNFAGNGNLNFAYGEANTIDSIDNGYTFGVGLTATHNNEMVFGQWNNFTGEQTVDSNRIFSWGMGLGNISRRNAATVYRISNRSHWFINPLTDPGISEETFRIGGDVRVDSLIHPGNRMVTADDLGRFGDVVLGPDFNIVGDTVFVSGGGGGDTVNIYTDNGTIPELRTVTYETGGIDWISPDGSDFFINSQGTLNNSNFKVDGSDEEISFQITGDELNFVRVLNNSIQSGVGGFGVSPLNRSSFTLNADGFGVGDGALLNLPTAALDVMQNVRIRQIDQNDSLPQILVTDPSGFVYKRNVNTLPGGGGDTVNIYTDDGQLDSLRTVDMNGNWIQWQNGSIYAIGGDNNVEFTGGGRRMMWVPGRRAFRAGEVTSSQWDFLGMNSVAFGYNNSANGTNTMSWGSGNTAATTNATAFGNSNDATGNYSTSWGQDNLSDGLLSTSWGANNNALGSWGTTWGVQTTVTDTASAATAWGANTTATGWYSTAFGNTTTANDLQATSWGQNSNANSSNSTVWGFGNNANGPRSTAWGQSNIANWGTETVFGQHANALTANDLLTRRPSQRLLGIGNGNTSFRSDVLNVFAGELYNGLVYINPGADTSRPAQNLRVGGDVRIDSLNATATKIVGADGDNVLGELYLGENITISGDTIDCNCGGGGGEFVEEFDVAIRTTNAAINWNSVTYGNGKYVAVSSTGTNRVLVSTDGITWEPETAADQNSWQSVTYGDGLFVAVSANSASSRGVMTSPDGVTWTGRPLPSGLNFYDWVSVTYGNGLFVAVAISGPLPTRIMSSPDGITWTERSGGEYQNWESVTYGNGLFVAVAQDGTDRVMTSPDGVTWTSRSAAEQNGWNAITYGNGLFVALSFDGTNRVMTSPDGVTWTSQTAAEQNTWESVTYGNGLFTAVSIDGTNRVMTSPDGVNWTARNSIEQESWRGIAYGRGKFIGVGNSSANILDIYYRKWPK